VREGSHLPADQFIEWLELNQAYLGSEILKIMGGEPTIHPDFYLMTEHALRYYGTVILFTNGSTLDDNITDPHILRAHIQGRFNFIINGFTAKTFNTNFFNHYALHFVVPFDEVNHKRMIKKVAEFAKDPKAHFIISGDTGVDLLNEDVAEQYRHRYLDFWKGTIQHINGRYEYDHPFPNCFFTQELIDELHRLQVGPVHESPSCCDRYIGLIGTDWSLTYCNQTRIHLGNIYRLIIPAINRLIQTAPAQKCGIVKQLSPKCAECPSVVTCKTHCWCRQLQNNKPDGS
jgi:hypothetical protein